LKNAIKFIVILLIFSMISFTLACNNAKNVNNTDNLSNNAEANNIDGGENSESAEAEEIPFPREIRDFEGYTFKVLIDKQWSGNHLDIEDLDIEEMNGEVLNDAYYTRKMLMEEVYNVKLEGIRVEDIGGYANKSVKAGLDEYDAYAPRLMNAATFATRGYGVNVLDTTLSLSAPWWDQNIINDTSIGGYAYFIAGDIFIKHYDGIALLMFNKKIIEDFGLESPYNLVNNNQWVVDKFNEMAKGVTFDLNNDGKMDRYDRYGFVTQADYVTSFINACGEKIVSKDNDDMPVFTGYSEKMVSVMDKMLDIYVDDTYCMHRNAYGKENGGGQLVQFWVFPEGRALFYWAFPRYMDLGLRNMEDNFGIVPLPKWDSNQPRYYATLNNWHSYTYMIPITVADVEKSAYIMDAMAYHGRQIIKPAYYDVCLQRKYTRDEESSAMLDIIFSSTVYDLGTVFGIGGITGSIEGELQRNQINLTSIYEKSVGRIEKDIAKLIDQFEANR